ncbi:MAG: dihydroorotase [Lachnospiraceae bacterium]|nr:dihydroorotase [Lachnospiraceae bacterium]
MNIYLHGARIMDPSSGLDAVSDIFISDGKITRIGPLGPMTMPEDTCRIEADGLIAAPGLVDIHVHFREPGFTYKEDIETGSLAAVAGGFTTVVMMANTKPCVDSVETLQMLKARIESVNRQIPLHILPSATVTKGLLGRELTDFVSLSDAGAVGFTDDGIPILDETLLQNAFSLAEKVGRPVSLHEEDPRLITENGINAGAVSSALHLTGSPREAEISMIRRDIEIANRTGAIVNIQHISTKEGVDLIRAARAVNPRIHAEATPHHFSLNENAVLKYGTNAKMNPPLRTEEDRLAIIEGLADGTIETIATDHAPHAAEEKSRDFTAAPSGITGLETALPLGITHLVLPGYLTMMQLLKAMTASPASLYNLPCGIREGAPADLVLFDPEAVQRVDRFYSRSCNTPFAGAELTGVVQFTIADGKISYRNQEETVSWKNRPQRS